MKSGPDPETEETELDEMGELIIYSALSNGRKENLFDSENLIMTCSNV